MMSSCYCSILILISTTLFKGVFRGARCCSHIKPMQVFQFLLNQSFQLAAIAPDLDGRCMVGTSIQRLGITLEYPTHPIVLGYNYELSLCVIPNIELLFLELVSLSNTN